MKRIIVPAVLALTALILTGSFFLPSFISRLRDRQTIGELAISGVSSISYETEAELGILERLQLINSAGTIPLNKGKNIESESAYQYALSELAQFNNNNIMAFDFDACRLVRYSVAFYVDASEPSKNLVAWSIDIQDKLHNITVVVDDETGKLLSIYYYLADWYMEKKIATSQLYDEVTIDVNLMTSSIANYYGLSAVQLAPVNTDKNLYLQYELSNGQNSILMGVINSGGEFWINI